MRARDASGNWGPVRTVVLPIDRAAAERPRVGRPARRGRLGDAAVRERDSGLALLRYRVELDGRAGRWHSLKPASHARLTLRVARGRRAILRVRAEDVAGNETARGS